MSFFAVYFFGLAALEVAEIGGRYRVHGLLAWVLPCVCWACLYGIYWTGRRDA